MAEKLTVLIPCKDERLNIIPCIQSIRPLADEILVADSGSTDGTLDIVRSLGDCRIIQREYVHSASFKNWAIPQATHGWVFIVDADERVTPEVAADVCRIKANPPEQFDAYRVAFQDFFLGHRLKYSSWDTESIRLLRRDVCRYRQRRVHSDIDIDPARVGRLQGHILHYSFWTHDQYIRKYARYTTWGAEELRDKGKRAGFRSMFLRPLLRMFQLYVLRGGFLDGMPGLQICMLTAFFNTFFKQAKLWEMQQGIRQPDSLAASSKSADGNEAPETLPIWGTADQSATEKQQYRRAA
jgi:glycosyltransferase involved in cell wall biosynthesis